MDMVNIHEAKTHLSRLIANAVEEGKSFLISKSGKPLVKVTPVDACPPKKMKRIGFMKGHGSIPDDFNQMGAAEIEGLFGA